jgi:hypothetical protein
MSTPQLVLPLKFEAPPLSLDGRQGLRELMQIAKDRASGYAEHASEAADADSHGESNMYRRMAREQRDAAQWLAKLLAEAY